MTTKDLILSANQIIVDTIFVDRLVAMRNIRSVQWRNSTVFWIALVTLNPNPRAY